TLRRKKKLLLVDDNEHDLSELEENLKADDVTIEKAVNARQALQRVKEEKFDCIVLDLLLPDASGLEIIKELEKQNLDPITSVIVYSAMDLTNEEKQHLEQFAHRIILKSPRSMPNLVDQVALFLHRRHEKLPEKMRETIERFCKSEDLLQGRTVLIVD